MTTPWTPPGEDLPEPAAQPWRAPPPLPAQQPYQPYPPPATYHARPPYPGGPHPDGIPPSKTMAGWALGLSLVGCLGVTLLVAVPLAIVVLVESSRDPRDRGKGMAIAALVISGVWAVVLVLGMVGNTLDSSSPPPVPDIGDDRTIDSRTGKELPRVPPAKLRVGDCFDDKALAGIDDGGGNVEADLVTLVPCDRLHDFEAYDVFQIRGSEFPGLAKVRRQAAVGCGKEFKPYVGRAYGPSDLESWIYYPTSKSWTLFDDHGVTCVVGEPGAKTAGTLHGSRR
jgi:hypothetical protein